MNTLSKFIASTAALIASLGLLWIAYGVNRPSSRTMYLIVGGQFDGQPIDVTLNSGAGGFELTR
jgi:hypothetical protein